MEGGIGFGEVIAALEFEERDHEGFGDVAAAVGTESAVLIGDGWGEVGHMIIVFRNIRA